MNITINNAYIYRECEQMKSEILENKYSRSIGIPSNQETNLRET